MIESFSLADLTEATGAPRRSVQLWAEAGALKADTDTDRAGTGTHRRFSRKEAIVACVLAAFHRMRVSIGTLIDFSEELRHILHGSEAYEDFEGCIRGEKTIFLFSSISRIHEGLKTHYLVFDGNETEEEKALALANSLVTVGKRRQAVVVSIELNSHLANLK